MRLNVRSMVMLQRECSLRLSEVKWGWLKGAVKSCGSLTLPTARGNRFFGCGGKVFGWGEVERGFCGFVFRLGESIGVCLVKGRC